MPLRDLSLTIVVFAALPVCVLRPWIGGLVWAWLSYMNPHRFTWGFASHMPFSEMVAVATVIGVLVTRERRPLPRAREIYLVTGLWIIFLLSTVFSALHPDLAWRHFARISKIMLMTGVTVMLFQDRRKLRFLLLVIALSIGFFGLKGGVWAVLTGGQYRVYGPPRSFISDNNQLGLALNMVLPLMVFLRREETRWWLRQVLLATVGFSVIAVLFTYSRGSFLGLVAVLSVLLLRRRAKVVALLVVLISIPVALSVLPRQWKGRMESITMFREDASAQKRLKAWYVSYRLACDHPLLGAGFRPFSSEVYELYIPGYSDDHDAHNIFFQVLAEHGFTGLILFAGLIASVFLSLWRTVRATRADESRQWLFRYAQMIEASMVAYLVSGMFINRPHFDLFYHLVAVTVILNHMTSTAAREAAPDPGRLRDSVEGENGASVRSAVEGAP